MGKEIVHTPKILRTASEVEATKAEHAPVFVNAFEAQLKELFFIRKTEFVGTPKDEAFASNEFSDFADEKKEDFVHVYYPWNNHLVKTVDAEDYYELKTNRNQDLITAEEQKELYGSHVAVFGLSVGSNIVTTLTQAGISKEITIADFDELDTTNLNRILAGIHQIGLPKGVVSARRVYEDNPFAEVHFFEEGVTQENIKTIAESGVKLIIEEVDSLPIKIQTRLFAMEHKLPVLMVTDNGDGVVLHVERYDLGCATIFGKEPQYWIDLMQKPAPPKEEMAKMIVDDIVGGADQVDPRMMKSVQRVINHELISWPQLGSAAILAGVVATVFTKRILLGENTIKDVRQTIFIPEDDLKTHG